MFVATDDHRISSIVKEYGFKFIMTSKKNLTGTDRVTEKFKGKSKYYY